MMPRMPAPLRPALLGLMALALLVVARPTLAQQETRRPTHCIALVERQTPDRIWRATWQDPVPEHSLRLHYISHASFLLRTPAGLNVVTDYNGFIGTTQMVPDVVTMNHAHDTHWTAPPIRRSPTPCAAGATALAAAPTTTSTSATC